MIDIDFDRVLHALLPISTLTFAELKEAFRFDEAYQRHERGELSASDYFAHLATVLELSSDPALVAESWNAVFVGEVTDTLAMIAAARADFRCFALTNTNAAHQAAWVSRFPRVVGSFDGIFCSHEIGVRKPDRAAFEYVSRRTGVPLDAIVFFDDLLENVASARAAGLRAVHVRGPDDVRLAFRTLGIAV